MDNQNLPTVEKIIRNANNRVFVVSSVLTVGAFLGISSYIGLGVGLLSFPFVLDTAFSKKYWHKYGYIHFMNDLTKPYYKNLFKTWLNDYLNNSENLTEKKYKLVFLHMWLERNHLKITEIFDVKDKEDVLLLTRKAIINGNESKYDIGSLFGEIYMEHSHSYQNSTSYDSSSSHLHINDIYDEDKDNPEKINIAKQVYKEFSGSGLLGWNIINLNPKNIVFLLIIQANKLFRKDFQLLENETKKKDYKFEMSQPMMIEYIAHLVSDKTNDIQSLKILEKYFKFCKESEKTNLGNYYSNCEKMINTKIEYLYLQENLTQQKTSNSIRKTNMKI